MWYLPLLKSGLLPDALVRRWIRRLLAQRLKHEEQACSGSPALAEERLVKILSQEPIAALPETANEQHYEVPSAFYREVLGPNLKYSSCYWPDGVEDIGTAEEQMLVMTCERAQLQDGMDILELGCGWGSLTLFMARIYPQARIVAVSNSHSQREWIEQEARRLGRSNITVITADMNEFNIGRVFDRVVSVEMFEHMRNYRILLNRVAGWLKEDGKLFIHIFCHARYPYLFETGVKDDWMARYFFSGGVMPSETLLDRFNQDLVVEKRWQVNGRHYERTLNDWLKRMDERKDRVMPILRDTYGAEAATWWIYWRVFFMASAELFGYRDGREWFVSHARFAKSPPA